MLICIAIIAYWHTLVGIIEDFDSRARFFAFETQGASVLLV